MTPRLALLAATVVVATACHGGSRAAAARADSVELTRRQAHLSQALARSESGPARDAPVARWVLGPDLAEISGLALTADGRLLTHADESGRIVELDYRRGAAVKAFRLGDQTVKADFEGITVAGDTLFLLASNGKLYQFREGADGQRVPFTIHDTGLKRECEFEGVAFDPAIQSLLLACKNVLTEGPLRDSLVVYRWKLPSGSDPNPTRLTVPLTQVIGQNKWVGVHPSDITVDPASGNYVLVAGAERALIEITPAGALVFARPLPEGLAHAEGVAITKDGILIVSTEGRPNTPAAVTLFRWPRSE